MDELNFINRNGSLRQAEAGYSDQARVMAKVVNLYYVENLNQAEIAKQMGISAAKVNRLLKAARQEGMVEIKIHLPFHNLIDLEARLCKVSSLKEVIVTPSIGDSVGEELTLLAQTAAEYVENRLVLKDRICIGGGGTISQVVDHLGKRKFPGLRVYPMIGGVQRYPNMDVNGHATRMAQRLGGEAIQFYAPAFAETSAERDTYFSLTDIIRALEQARSCRVALFGIGSLRMGASIIQYCSLPYRQLAQLVEQRGGVGEVLGYVFDENGKDCIPELSRLVIGISLDDILKIPVRIGVAAGSLKAPAIAAAIKGGYFTNLILDEAAAEKVLGLLEQ